MFFWNLAAAIVFGFLERFLQMFLPSFPLFEKNNEKSPEFQKFSLCKEQKMGYNKV